MVLGSRIESGRVAALEVYDHLDAVTVDNLSPQRARILVMCSLLKYMDSMSIQKIFNEY